jgi:hypothetical protein
VEFLSVYKDLYLSAKALNLYVLTLAFGFELFDFRVFEQNGGLILLNAIEKLTVFMLKLPHG